MAKNTFLSFSTTAGDNTDVGGIGILGTNAVSNFDNALRTLMAILRGDLDNGTVFVTKAAGYTAVAGDNNAFYEFTATATLSLTAADTLAADWHMTVFANGGAVTIDPDGSELINGATTFTISNGDAAYIICTGAAFKAVTIPASSVQASVNVASAATTNLGAAASQNVRVTGTTTITSFGTAAAGVFKRVLFAASLTLTHNSTSLILPGAANITTTAGDIACFVSEGSGNWRCASYERYVPVISAPGTAPIFACRAWGNFVGATGAISASGNAASVVRNSTGNYTVTLTTAMPDANYCAVASHSAGTTNNGATVTPINSSSFTIITSGNGILADPLVVGFAVFR